MKTHFHSSFQSLLAICAMTLLVLIAPASAQAGAFESMDDASFANSDKVSDNELSKVRGGFLNVNGLLIDVNFLSRVQVGLVEQSNFSINTSDLANAALTANQINDFIQTQIIQNNLDDQVIAAYQNLTVTVANTATLDTMAQANQLQALQAMQ